MSEKPAWHDLLTKRGRADRSVIIKLEREQFQRRVNDALSLAKRFTNNAALSVQGTPLIKNEVEEIRSLITSIIKPNKQNAGIYEHLNISSRIAREIANRLKEQDEKIDPIKIEIRTFLDDLGRLIGQQRYVRNDLEGRAFGVRIGLREDFFDRRSAKDTVNPDAFNFDELSIEDRIVMIADLIGKRESDGKVRTFRQALTYHYASRHDPSAYKKRIGGVDPAFPSELRGLRAMENDKHKFGTLYEDIYEWLKERGIDVDEIGMQI